MVYQVPFYQNPAFDPSISQRNLWLLLNPPRYTILRHSISITHLGSTQAPSIKLNSFNQTNPTFFIPVIPSSAPLTSLVPVL